MEKINVLDGGEVFFKKNSLSASLFGIAVLLNIFYMAVVLSNMSSTVTVAYFSVSMITYLFLLFIAMINIQNYSMKWTYIAIGIIALQFSRIFFDFNEGITSALHTKYIWLYIVPSGIAMIGAVIYSFKMCNQLLDVKNSENNEFYMSYTKGGGK